MAKNKPCNVCPKCGGKSEVTDVRYRTGVPRRVRRCLSCGRKWSTVEIMEYEWTRGAAGTHDDD